MAGFLASNDTEQSELIITVLLTYPKIIIGLGKEIALKILDFFYSASIYCTTYTAISIIEMSVCLSRYLSLLALPLSSIYKGIHNFPLFIDDQSKVPSYPWFAVGTRLTV